MKAVTKALGEALVVGSGWSSVTRRSLRGCSMVLAFHNVVPDAMTGRGDASLHLSATRFSQHLAVLSRHCRVVPLLEVIDPPAAPDRDRPRVAITFDDAYRGSLALGLDLLSRRGMPATVFAAPALLDDRTAWWDALADPMGGGLDRELRGEILRAGGGVEDARRMAGPAPWARMPALLRIATAEELRLASRRPGVRIGSHAWSHRNLEALGKEEIDEDLQAARHWLRRHMEAAYLDAVSYPYGKAGGNVRDAARNAGYRAGLTLHGGWVPEAADPGGLPRLNVPAGLSSRGLILRISRR